MDREGSRIVHRAAFSEGLRLQGASPFVQTEGTGSIKAVPDRGTLLAGTVTEGKNASEVQRQNAEEAASILAAVTSAGIPRKNIQTSEYRLDIVYDYAEGKQVLKGYRASHIFSILLENISAAGGIIDTAARSGANYISGITFQLSNFSYYYNQALILAARQAKEKAAAIAGASGLSLNPMAAEISEITNGISVPRVKSFASAGSPMIQTPIEPGEMTVEAKVLAKFFIQYS
ncbi:SIMPL domain-containing protein [Peribacillus kribbensis]|uniref:SIMPL domain-containing protein n=1 Tax=Peribacillus kribbensis TaxID=356658 RepID=UPI00047C74C9|nr:SIMPL domain-containing protein [Peribacillus kribbensis]